VNTSWLTLRFTEKESPAAGVPLSVTETPLKLMAWPEL
jgi:hypothetical protein